VVRAPSRLGKGKSELGRPGRGSPHAATKVDGRGLNLPAWLDFPGQEYPRHIELRTLYFPSSEISPIPTWACSSYLPSP
jgi:hypothetical protein